MSAPDTPTPGTTTAQSLGPPGAVGGLASQVPTCHSGEGGKVIGFWLPQPLSSGWGPFGVPGSGRARLPGLSSRAPSGVLCESSSPERGARARLPARARLSSWVPAPRRERGVCPYVVRAHLCLPWPLPRGARLSTRPVWMGATALGSLLQTRCSEKQPFPVASVPIRGKSRDPPHCDPSLADCPLSPE